MRERIKRQAVKWAGTLVGAAAGALTTWGLVLPQDFEMNATLTIAGLLMAVFTKVVDWGISLIPIDLREENQDG